MNARSSLQLSCFDGDECIVYFEPWGTEHVLTREDHFRIETDALAKGAVEISVVSGGISVCVSSEDEIRIVNKSGTVLPI